MERPSSKQDRNKRVRGRWIEESIVAVGGVGKAEDLVVLAVAGDADCEELYEVGGMVGWWG